MARNRQRAKDRRDRDRRAQSPPPRGAGRPRSERAPRRRPDLAPADDESLTPDPLDHASGEVEEAEAYLAAGARAPGDASPADGGDALTMADDLDDLDATLADDEADGARSDGRGGAIAVAGARAPAATERRGNPVAAFLRASWRELQRVQWPDRRQVAQATGVVVGFVIVAGVFLGVADLIASKIVHAIL